MKVKELIEQLQKQDPEAEIEVPVKTYTQRYPVGYFSLSKITKSPWGMGIRLWVHLPKGFIVSKRKEQG